jgi:hypothetical protein
MQVEVDDGIVYGSSAITSALVAHCDGIDGKHLRHYYVADEMPKALLDFGLSWSGRTCEQQIADRTFFSCPGRL